MNYYKVIDNTTFIGVVTSQDFRVFQQKHQVLLRCDEKQAQYVQCGNNLYRTGWLAPINTDKLSYVTADIINIEKAEYDALCKAIENDDEVIIEESVEAPEIVDDSASINEVVTVDYLMKSKISEMRQTCSKVIENGIDVVLSDGNKYHFSLTTQDQLNLITLSSMAEAGETLIPYHADGELCRYYSAEDIALITNAAASHKIYHTTYFNSLKVYINTLTEIADIASVQYGMLIPDEYQSEILKVILASNSKEEE